MKRVQIWILAVVILNASVVAEASPTRVHRTVGYGSTWQQALGDLIQKIFLDSRRFRGLDARLLSNVRWRPNPGSVFNPLLDLFQVSATSLLSGDPRLGTGSYTYYFEYDWEGVRYKGWIVATTFMSGAGAILHQGFLYQGPGARNMAVRNPNNRTVLLGSNGGWGDARSTYLWEY